MKDLHNNIKPVKALTPQVITADASATDIDLLDCGSAEIMFHIGASGDTLSESVKADLKLSHSDDGETYTAVTESDLINGNPDADGVVATIDADGEDDMLYSFGYIGGKRYVQADVDLTGTHSNGMPVAITVIKGHMRNTPA